MSLDSQISQCNNEIESYRILRRNLENVVNYLISSKNDCIDIKSKISNLYQVNDGDSNIKNRVSNLSNNVEFISNNILNKVIPAIDSKIGALNKYNYDLQVAKANEDARKSVS